MSFYVAQTFYNKQVFLLEINLVGLKIKNQEASQILSLFPSSSFHPWKAVPVTALQ